MERGLKLALWCLTKAPHPRKSPYHHPTPHELPKRGYRLRVSLRRPSIVPLESASAVVGDLAWPQNMTAALADVDAVIHSAGLARAMSGLPEDDRALALVGFPASICFRLAFSRFPQNTIVALCAFRS